jgi:hypothetical protein
VDVQLGVDRRIGPERLSKDSYGAAIFAIAVVIIGA